MGHFSTRFIGKINNLNLPLVIFVIASLFYTANIDGQGLSLDEGETLVTANAIFKYGVPASWDGLNIITTASGLEFNVINGIYVWRWHPWLQHYLTVIGEVVFGYSPAGARIPFAVFGAGTVAALYVLGERVFKSKKIALILAVQLMFLLPFFLYSRQIRYYSPSAFFSLIAFYFFITLVQNKWQHNFRVPLLISTILLFFTNYVTWGSTCFTIGALAIFRKRKDVVVILLIEFSLALLWFIVIKPFGGNVLLQSSLEELPHKILSYSHYINSYVFPLILLPITFLANRYRVVLCAVFVFVIAKLFFYGVLYHIDGRYLIDLFAILIFLYGFIYKYAQTIKNKYLVIPLFLIVTFTNLLSLPLNALFNKPSDVRFWLLEYRIELFEKYESPISPITNYMKKEYSSGDLFISDSLPFDIYYHSGVPYYNSHCNTDQYLRMVPEKNKDISRLRWVILVNNPERVVDYYDTSCYGDELSKYFTSNFRRVVFEQEKYYSLNNPDVAIRHFPPYEIDLNGYIQLYESIKQGN